MILPSVRLFTLYILLFKKEPVQNADNDYIVMTGLGKVFMPGLLGMFPVDRYMVPQEMDMDDYDIDRDELRIMDNEKVIEICRKLLQTNSWEIGRARTQSSHEFMKDWFQYKLITIPFTQKKLERMFSLIIFDECPRNTMETQKLSLLYSTNEILARKFSQCYSKNSVPTTESLLVLYQHPEKKNYKMSIQADLMLIHQELAQFISYGVVDKGGNIAVTSKENVKLYIKVPIETFNEQSKLYIDYFACDYQYVLDNVNFMQEIVLNDQHNDLLTTTDIDFRNYIYELQLSNSPPNESIASDGMVCININSMFQGEVFKSITFQKLILRLSNVHLNISSLSIRAYKIILYCSDSTIEASDELPNILTEFYIWNSRITNTIELHYYFEKLFLKNVTINRGFEVVVNKWCRTIEIANVTGSVIIPFVDKYKKIFQVVNWEKFVLIKDMDKTVNELSICNVRFADNWSIIEKIKTLRLENIMCVDEPTIIINEDCQHLFVSKCMCRISLVKSIFIEKLELSYCKKMIETNADQGKMLRVLRLIKNCIDPCMPIYGNIKKIYIHNDILIIQRANHLLIPSGCNNVILRNWIGTIDLSGFGFGALYTGMKTINFEYYFDNLEQVHYLHFFSGSISIDSNFFSCNQKHKLLLENVKISGDSILLINEKCISIRVVNCTSSINIPKVLNEEGDLLLGLDDATRFYFIKQQNGKYYMRMCNVEIKETTVLSKKVEVVVLENIKSRNGAVILFDKGINQFIISNCDIQVHQQALDVDNNIIRLRTSNVCYRWLNGHIFRANKFSAKICRLSQTATRLIINGCQIDSGYKFGIDSCCKYVYITGYRGTFVLFGSLGRETINVQFNGDSRFIFIKTRFGHDYIMQLYECILKGTMKIEINVKHLILKDAAISNESNQGTTGNLQWSNFFELEDLQSIVLINIEEFDFRRCVNLNYLRLENITINQDVSFSKSLKVLELINVTFTERRRLKLHRNFRKFYISGGTGESLSRQFFNTDITKSCDNKISSQRNAKSEEKLCCYLASIDFQRNFYVPEETETLTLENIKMQEGQVLKINMNCKSLKIVSFVGVLDIRDARSLRSVVLHNKMPRIVGGQWIYLNNDMIDTSSKSDVTDYIFPYCLKVIVLRNVEFKYSSTLIISQKCKNLSIISCAGNYDLSRIKKLYKLTFYPSQHKKIFITFPDLTRVRELDIAYNGNPMYFKWLLVNCRTIKKLTIHALTFNLHMFDCSTTSKESISAHGYNKIDEEKIVNTYTQLREVNCRIHDDEENKKLLNHIMNILIQPIFNVRTQNNLETLELFGFQLSESNANLLNEFVVLTKICVSYEMIDAKFPLSMFSNIRKLEIHRDLNMSDHFAENIVLCNEQCIKLLGELKCTEELTIEGQFFKKCANFGFLPPNLKHLRVLYYKYNVCHFDPNYKRLTLDKLTLLMYPNDESQIKWNDVERQIHIEEMLDYLSHYIELEKLEELIVEDNQGVILHHHLSEY